MNEIATALKDIVDGITGLGADLYFGDAPQGTDLPYITFMPMSDVPIHLMQGKDDQLSITHWDFKVWGKSTEIGDIYQKLMDAFNDEANIPDGYVSLLRGRGLPMRSEENRANEIIYSRIVECEVIL